MRDAKILQEIEVRDSEERLAPLGEFFPVANHVYFKPETEHCHGGPHGISKSNFQQQVGKVWRLKL